MESRCASRRSIVPIRPATSAPAVASLTSAAQPAEEPDLPAHHPFFRTPFARPRCPSGGCSHGPDQVVRRVDQPRGERRAGARAVPAARWMAGEQPTQRLPWATGHAVCLRAVSEPTAAASDDPVEHSAGALRPPGPGTTPPGRDRRPAWPTLNSAQSRTTGGISREAGDTSVCHRLSACRWARRATDIGSATSVQLVALEPA